MNLRIEIFESRAVTILDEEFETTDAAQSLNGRGREDGDEGLLNAGVLAVQCLHDCSSAEVLSFPLFLRLQGHEDNAGIRRIDESIDGQTWERHRALDARLLERDRRHLANDRFSAVECGGVRQLSEGDEVGLVLRWHEAARNFSQAKVGQSDETEVDDQRYGRNAQHS